MVTQDLRPNIRLVFTHYRATGLTAGCCGQTSLLRHCGSLLSAMSVDLQYSMLIILLLPKSVQLSSRCNVLWLLSKPALTGTSRTAGHASGLLQVEVSPV